MQTMPKRRCLHDIQILGPSGYAIFFPSIPSGRLMNLQLPVDPWFVKVVKIIMLHTGLGSTINQRCGSKLLPAVRLASQDTKTLCGITS